MNRRIKGVVINVTSESVYWDSNAVVVISIVERIGMQIVMIVDLIMYRLGGNS